MTQEQQESAPDRVIKSGPGPSWLIYVLLLPILLALGGGLWYLLAPESMARLYGSWADEELSVKNLVLTVNRQTVELPPNATMEIHPGQVFAVAGLNTNRPLNYDLNLYSPDFDIQAVAGGTSAAPKDLLPGESFERPRVISIVVRENERLVAEFKILSRYTALDFAAKGDAAKEDAEKADHYQKALALDPSSRVVKEKLLSALIASKQSGRAAEIYEAELAEKGPDEELLQRLLDLYRAMEELPQQVEVLGRLRDLARSQGREATVYQEQLADLYKAGGRPDQAAEIYEELLPEAAAENVPGYLGELIALYRALGDTDREIAALKRLAEIAPSQESVGIWSEIVTLYNRSGDKAGLIRAWQTLADLLPEGESKVNAYINTALLQQDLGQLKEAAATFRAAQKMAPEQLSIVFYLAALAEAEGDREEYRAQLEKAVKLKPENLDFRLALAQALKSDQQNAKARSQYLEILKLRPDDTDLRLPLIELLEEMNDKDELVRQYEALLEKRPEDKIIAYNYGVLLFERKKKDWPKTIAAFRKVLELDPEDNEARAFLLSAYQSAGQRREMLEQALELYRRDPSQGVYKELMLNSCENAKDWAGYAKAAQAITQAEPDSSSGWELLARAQNNLNQKSEAARSLWQAAERAQNKKAEAWLKTGSAFEEAKKYDDSLRAYQKALELEPKNRKAGEKILEINLKKAKGEG